MGNTLDYEVPPPVHRSRWLVRLLVICLIVTAHCATMAALYKSGLPDKARFLLPTVAAALLYAVALFAWQPASRRLHWTMSLVIVALAAFSFSLGLSFA